MSYEFEPGKMYRMPTHFGPSLGPRQGPGGQVYENVTSPSRFSCSVSFLTDGDQLALLLPPRFELDGDPVVTVTAANITNIEWLAGRGYNTLGVTCPVVFHARDGDTHGNHLLVLWENLADPIITGREELGYPKVYCELPDLDSDGTVVDSSAAWLGHEFFKMKAERRHVLDPAELADFARAQKGVLTYKYMPRTQAWGESDAEYVTFTPPADLTTQLKDAWRGDGTLSFERSAWDDLPTLYAIVNSLASLPIREWRGALVQRLVGATDYRPQQVLQ